jgi:hypothetical protein
METTAPPPHASGPEDPDYRTKALQDLKRAVEGNLRALQDAVSQTPLDTVAWRARNLLELSIWVAYCASSRERAKMFCEDAARDAIDMLNILPEDRRDPTYSYPATRAQLIAKAKQGGIEDIEDPLRARAHRCRGIGQEEPI